MLMTDRRCRRRRFPRNAADVVSVVVVVIREVAADVASAFSQSALRPVTLGTCMQTLSAISEYNYGYRSVSLVNRLSAGTMYSISRFACE